MESSKVETDGKGRDMQVEQWQIQDVKPYENNPRKNDEAVEKVANSIREFGFRQPLVVDSEGVVIVGHTRLKAAQSLGLDEVPVVVAEDLTDEQVKAYRLADNKTGELAGWDWDMLNLELEDIDWLDMNMEQFGFSTLSFIDATVDDEETKLQRFDEYAQEAELDTNFCIIISCASEEEKTAVAAILNVDSDKVKRLYSASEIIERN